MKKTLPIFTLEEITENLIVIKVNCNDNLTAAKNPPIDTTYDYISITRGEEHIFEVIHKDGTSYNFHFGEKGYTCISKPTELLKTKVLRFLEDRHILINYERQPLIKATVFYNNNYHKWQITMEDSSRNSIYFWSKTASCAADIINECKPFIVSQNWNNKKASTGIDIWEAENPQFKIIAVEKREVNKDLNLKNKTIIKETERE